MMIACQAHWMSQTLVTMMPSTIHVPIRARHGMASDRACRRAKCHSRSPLAAARSHDLRCT